MNPLRASRTLCAAIVPGRPCGRLASCVSRKCLITPTKSAGISSGPLKTASSEIEDDLPLGSHFRPPMPTASEYSGHFSLPKPVAEAYPLFVIIALACSFAIVVGYHTATGPDTVWDRADPEPWQAVKDGEQVRLINLSNTYEGGRFHRDWHHRRSDDREEARL